MALYGSLADARMEANPNATNTNDDVNLLRYLRQLSRRIDNDFRQADKPVRPIFEPYIEARAWPLTSMNVNSVTNTFALPSSLLAVTGVTLGTNTLTLNTNVEAWPDTTVPIPSLRLMGCCGGWYSYDCGLCGDPLMVTITGTWGFHSDYANAWQKVDDLTLAVNAALTDTTLTVADVDGVDAYGITPRISAGNLLLVGTEYMEVTATNTGTNTATVRRAVNGSTLAAHGIGDDVSVWQVEDPIRREVARQAAFQLARRGAYSTFEITDAGGMRFPADMLASLRAVMQEYAYVL